MKKRFVSVILVLCMVLGMVPLKAFAAESGTFTEPKVTQLTVSYDGGEPVDLLGNQPTISMPAGSKPVFTVTFDSTELLNKVFVTSTKDGEIKYLEAKLQDGKYVTDSYFDPNDTNYIPGAIAVTYSKKTLKIDESGNIGGTDLNTLKTQLTAQGVSSRNEATGADGTVTAEIVLGDTFGAMANVYFDATVSEFTAGAGIDQSELDRWLGVYQNLSKLSTYDLEGADGKKFTLYLGDGKDFGDPDTYLVMIKDATSNKYTKTLLQKAADKAGLGDISDTLSSTNVVTKKLLEYNAISKDTAALREEITAHPTMTEQEKAEANERITALDRDKKLFLMGMTAFSFLFPPASAPLMLSALLAGYSSMADYFWDYRVGLIKGCDSIDNVFTESSDHPGWMELTDSTISQSGNYFLTKDFGLLQISENTRVTLCLHGHTIKGITTMKSGSTLTIRDCKYAENEDGTVSGGMLTRTITMQGQNELTLEQGIIQGNYGHAIVSEGNSGKIIINGGIIEGVNGSIIADDGGNGEIAINGGVLKHSGSMGNGIRINNGSKLIINAGIINCENAIHTYDANGNSNAVIQINGGEITGRIRAGTGQLSITHGKIYGNINNSDCTTTTLLIQNNSDIQVSGTSAFSKAPTVKAGTGYTGGVTYYNSVTSQGTPMTIEEAATAGYTGPYVRLVASGAVSGNDKVTVTPSTGGNVTFTPSEPADGDTVTITVTPDSGYQGGAPVVKDSGGNTIPVTDAGNGKYTFTKPAGQVTITAPEFTRPTYSVTAPVSTPNGSVTVSAAAVHEGDTVTITVTPNAGYQGSVPVVKDADGNTLAITDAGNGKYTFVMPAKNVVVTAAEFTPTSYTITGPSKPSNGTVSLSAATAHKGDTVTITVTPDVNFTAKTPVVTGASGNVAVTKVSDTTYTFVMPEGNVTVDASFSVINFTLAYTPYASMTDADKKLYYGGKLEITGLVPNTKYVVTFDNGLAAPKQVNGRNVIPRIAHVVTSDAAGKVALGCQDSMNVMVFGVSNGGNVTTDLVELYAKNHAGVPVSGLASRASGT